MGFENFVEKASIDAFKWPKSPDCVVPGFIFGAGDFSEVGNCMDVEDAVGQTAGELDGLSSISDLSLFMRQPRMVTVANGWKTCAAAAFLLTVDETRPHQETISQMQLDRAPRVFVNRALVYLTLVKNQLASGAIVFICYERVADGFRVFPVMQDYLETRFGFTDLDDNIETPFKRTTSIKKACRPYVLIGGVFGKLKG